MKKIIYLLILSTAISAQSLDLKEQKLTPRKERINVKRRKNSKRRKKIKSKWRRVKTKPSFSSDKINKLRYYFNSI